MTIFDLTNDDQAGVELVEAVLAIRSRLDLQSAELAQLKATVGAHTQTIGEMRTMLATMGDLCHALAAAADRLMADS